MTPPPEASRPGLARRMAGNTLQATLGRAVALLLWLAVTPPIFHTLTREQFGVWSLFFALTGYLGSLDLGLAQVTLRHAAGARARGDDSEAGEFATIAILGYLALTLVWLAVTPLLAGWLPDLLRLPESVRGDARFALMLGPIVFGLVGLTNVTLSLVQAYGRFDLANVINLVSATGQAGGIVLALRTGHGLPGVLLASAAGWGLAFLAGLLVVRRAAPGFAWASPARSARRLGATLRFGGPMQLANTVAVFHQQVDKLVLTRAGALVAVGPYELGLRVATSAALVPYLMLLTLVPEAAGLHAVEASGRLRELFDRATRYVLSATAVMSAALWAGADLLFAAWLGEPQALAATALRGLVVALALALSAGSTSSLARAVGRTSLEAEYAIVALAVHLVAAFALVPRFHLVGALAALCLGNLAAGVWFVWRFATFMKWPRTRVLLTPMGVPLLAAMSGAGAGLLTERALPAVHGVLAWGAAGLVAAVAGGVALGVVLLFRFLPRAELWSLVSGLVRRDSTVAGGGG